MLYEKYLSLIDENKDIFCDASDYIWDNAELPFNEHKAASRLKQILAENGFDIEENISGIPTAFKASFGLGHPHLGVLAEYDALDGMSQEACIAEKKSVPGTDVGHGCGHNLFAGGSLAAVFAVKAYIEEKGKGRVTLFGCPAEEGGAGKVFMARDGVFSDVDSVVSWHPEKMYMVRTRPALANVKVDYSFEGVAAHAGGSPEKGRSALDALELMNIGANFLREHMDLTSRIHYAILDAGGKAPNMVQSHAKVRYMIRAVDNEAVILLKERVDRIAQGAALMTDTDFSQKIISSYSSLITIPTLQATANEAMQDIPLPVPDDGELAFAEDLKKTMSLTDDEKKQPLYPTAVKEPAPPVAHGGSTDTADVSWNCPTVQMHIGNWVSGTPGHSWQAVAQGKSSYAKKAMLYAGKAVASTIIRLFENPGLIERAKQEHREKTKGGYECLLPADAVFEDVLD